LIEEGIALAKDAKDGKVYMGFIFIGEEIAHAKAAKDGNPTSLSLGRLAELGMAPATGGWRARKWSC